MKIMNVWGTHFAKCWNKYFRILKFGLGSVLKRHLRSLNFFILFASSWAIKLLNSSRNSFGSRFGNFLLTNSLSAVATAFTGISLSLIEKCGSMWQGEKNILEFYNFRIVFLGEFWGNNQIHLFKISHGLDDDRIMNDANYEFKQWIKIQKI